MAAWRGPSSPHETEASFTDRVEDDEKQKLCRALGDSQGEAGGLQIIKECRVSGLLSRLRTTFVTGSCRPFTSFRKPPRGGYSQKTKRRGTKLTPRDDSADGEAREQLLRQERRVESTAGAIFVDGEVVRKPLRQDLEQAPSIHANVTKSCHVDGNSDVSAPRSGPGILYRWIISVLRCLFCTSSYSISASGENTGHDEAKSDQQRLKEARLQRSVIQLKRKDHFGDVDAVDDPTNLVTTAFRRTDELSASILDTHVEMVPSAEVIINIESELVVDLGGPGVLLGGLSLLGYKHVVFSVCPASLIDIDLE